MLGLPTQSNNDEEEWQAVRWRRRQVVRTGATMAAREERRVTADIVLGLFWSGFGSTKYMDKIQRIMYGR